MKISPDLKRLITEAVDAEHSQVGAQIAHRLATEQLKAADDKARSANQKLLDELRKTPNLRDGLRILQIGNACYLTNPLASATGGVVQSVSIEREDA